MKYFIDLEFIEGRQKKFFGSTKPTIDLISIGMVDEAGREFYAISKDFNIKEAWNRYDEKVNKQFPHGPEYIKEYWIRDNVLFPIFNEMIQWELEAWNKQAQIIGHCSTKIYKFTYSDFKSLIKKYGQTNREIASDICRFVYGDDDVFISARELANCEITDKNLIPEFYAYYAAYDWVAFCWIFGKMLELPRSFPKYCRDLKQILDQKAEAKDWYYGRDIWSNTRKSGEDELQVDDYPAPLEDKINKIKAMDSYPKQTNEHNAISDAKWNFELYKFLKTL